MTTQSEAALTIAVAGATGRQGRAAAEALTDAGADARAVGRDAVRPAAKQLRERGAQLVTADLDREQTLVADRIPGGAAEIAGDELTGEQIAAAFGAAGGREARYEPLPLDALSGDDDQQAVFGWFGRLPAYQADFELTRDLDPAVWDFPAWLANW